MTFWHYIIIGLIIQAIIIVERLIRLPWIRQEVKENLTNPWFWIATPLLMINIIAWPVSIYSEIRLIQNGI